MDIDEHSDHDTVDNFDKDFEKIEGAILRLCKRKDVRKSARTGFTARYLDHMLVLAMLLRGRVPQTELFRSIGTLQISPSLDKNLNPQAPMPKSASTIRSKVNNELFNYPDQDYLKNKKCKKHFPAVQINDHGCGIQPSGIRMLLLLHYYSLNERIGMAIYLRGMIEEGTHLERVDLGLLDPWLELHILKGIEAAHANQMESYGPDAPQLMQYLTHDTRDYYDIISEYAHALTLLGDHATRIEDYNEYFATQLRFLGGAAKFLGQILSTLGVSALPGQVDQAGRALTS